LYTKRMPASIIIDAYLHFLLCIGDKREGFRLFGAKFA
jgi:hypothetical protein